MAGECLIFDYNKFENSDPRKGSEHDVKRLEHDFSALGFDVAVHPNKTTRETKNILKDASQVERLSNTVFICCILSHGDSGRIHTSDGIIYVNDFLKPFEQTSSEGIPKIFIIQACQGPKDEKHVAVIASDSSSQDLNACQGPKDENYVAVIASDSSSQDLCKLTMGVDFLVITSTYPGTLSHRQRRGSYFIQGLCKCLEQYSYEYYFLDILIAVSRHMAYNFEERKTYRKQMPCIFSTLTRDIHFNKCIPPYEGTAENSPDKIEPKRREITNENVVRMVPRLDVSVDNPYYSVNGEVDFLLFHYQQNSSFDSATAKIDVHFKEFEFWGIDFELEMGNFETTIKKYADLEERNPECFICCVATYYKSHILYAKNEGFLKDLIWDTFTGNQCRFLAGKPKIFIFVTCKPPDDLKQPPVLASDAAYVCTIPEHADCIEVHLAVKDMEHLLPAVRIFCDVLKEYRQNLDFLNILTKINYELFNNEQFKDLNVEDKPLITIFSTLTRSIMLPH